MLIAHVKDSKIVSVNSSAITDFDATAAQQLKSTAIDPKMPLKGLHKIPAPRLLCGR